MLLASLVVERTGPLAQETGVPQSYSIVLSRLLLSEKVGEVLEMIRLFGNNFIDESGEHEDGDLCPSCGFT